jgi:hypothetical protein
MRKLNILIMALSILVVFAPSVQGVDATPVDRARDAVLEYFLPVSGKIEDVKEETVKVSLDGDISASNNIRLNVFREGEPFYHPVTNEKLGSTEYSAGRIEIKERDDTGLYTAVIKSGEAEAGDRVRIQSSKIKLAFFQERKADWILSELFYNSLKDSGRFEILEAFTHSYEPEELSRLATKLEAEALLLFSTPFRGEKKVLNVKLLWAEDTERFAEIEETLDKDIADMDTPGDEFLKVDMIKREPWERFKVESGIIMTMGDINNNGKMEFVVSDGNAIRIYSKGKDLREEWFIEGAPSERHLSIDVLDLNNNGYAEIFVTSFASERKIRSYVLEYYPSGEIRKISENIPYFLRVSGKKLLMQEHGYISPFKGPVHEGVLQDGEYRPGKSLDLPAALNIYGFVHVDWQESGDIHMLAFDDMGFLNLYDPAGNRLWKSRGSYGKHWITGRMLSQLSDDPSKDWFVRNRLIPVKTDRGQEVFVVNRIPGIELLPGLGYNEAEVHSIWWNGETMEHRPVLKELPGTVRDYRIAGKSLYLLADDSMFGIAKNVISGDFSKSGAILYYNIKGQ